MKKTLCILLTILALITTACGSGATPIKRSDTASKEETTEESEKVPEALSTEISEDTSESVSEVSSDTSYKVALEKEVEARVKVISKSTEELIGLVGDSYDGYSKNKEKIEGWYVSVLNESSDLYNSIKEQNIGQYKAIVDNMKSDDSYDWQKDMDDIYKAWDNAMSDYYDEWNDLYGDVYDQWDDAISKDDSIDYSTSSEAWSGAYSTHSDAWSAQYSLHSDTWSELYGNHSAVWSGLFSGETDIDKLIEEASKSTVSEDNSVGEKEESSEIADEVAKTDDDSESKLSDDLIRDDVKEAIDTYEAFVDEYCEFMKSYDPSNLKSLSKYTDLMTKEIEMAKEFEDIEDKDLTDAEALYYSQVSVRCSGKMLEAASKIK